MPSEVEAFVNRLAAERSAGTVRNAVSVLSAIFRAARLDRVLAVSPLEGVRQPAYQPTARIPERAEIDALYAAAATVADRGDVGRGRRVALR
jgi:hypothetical protein